MKSGATGMQLSSSYFYLYLKNIQSEHCPMVEVLWLDNFKVWIWNSYSKVLSL